MKRVDQEVERFKRLIVVLLQSQPLVFSLLHLTNEKG